MASAQLPLQRPIDTDERLSLAIVRAIADRQGVTVPELDPLHDYVDLELLDQFVAHTSGEGQHLRIEFVIEEYRVTVLSDTKVIVHDRKYLAPTKR